MLECERDDVDAAAVERLTGLAHALLSRCLATADAGEIGAAEPCLQDWPTGPATRRLPRTRLPVLAHLAGAAATATPATLPLVEALAGDAAGLHWRQSYTAADLGPTFLDRYGWTEFIGLRGPIPSTRLACGVLMLGPDTHYPPHAHEAEELYLPLAGTALWLRGGEGYASKAPGLPIHHPPWVPHAMQTAAEPLLALYLWRGGDLAAKSRLAEQT